MRHFTFITEAERRAALAEGPQADVMFQCGLDTRDIASLQWRREADVLRELNVQRSRRLGLPNPYEARA